MSVMAHLDVLQKKHDLLGKQIEQAYAHHASDMELHRLKKEKLRLKDEIQIFQFQLEDAA